MKQLSLCVLLATTLLVTGGCLLNKNQSIIVRSSARIASQHNHRGMVQVEKGVAQGDLNVDLPLALPNSETDLGFLTLSSWANLNLQDDTGKAWFPQGQGGKFSEIDLTAQYSPNLSEFGIPVNAAVGVLAYILPNGSDFPNGVRGSTTEFFMMISKPLFEQEIYSFTPSIRMDYDPDEVDGFYFVGEINKGIQINDLFRVDLGVGLGYSEENHSDWTYGVDAAGLADLRGTAALTYIFDEATTVTLGLGASTIIDSEIRDWFDLIDIDSENFWVSLGVGWTFDLKANS